MNEIVRNSLLCFKNEIAYSATVTNLQQKVEQLTTTNALMKEDLAIARNSVLSLQAENAALRQHQTSNRQLADSNNVLDRFDPEMAETLAEERRKRQDSERELELQVCLKAETEMAMKLLEKDIHEKQDTIVSLRRQLDDIKQINLEMYMKLQVIVWWEMIIQMGVVLKFRLTI